MGESCNPHLSIRLVGTSIIKATTDPKAQPTLVPLSHFDRLSGHYPVTVFHAYCKPPSGDFSSVVAAIKTSLSEILAFFPTFAGRLVPNPVSGDLEALCNNEGAELIEAQADGPLASLDLYHIDALMKKLILPFDHEVPLSLQVTGYACGGFSVVWNFDHLLADAAGIAYFLARWSEMARTKNISTVPNHDRSMLRPLARPPPTRTPSLDRIFATCTVEEISKCPQRGIVKRLYYVEGSCLDRLRADSSRDGDRRTRMEALSAHMWKILARSLGETDAGVCSMGWLVDGRTRMGGDPDTMSNYVGNLVSTAAGEATAREVKEGSLSHVAGMVSRAIREVTTNGAYFLDLANWIEEHRRLGMIVPKIMLSLGGPGVLMSSCHNMPVMSTDFGFGPPSVGTFYTTMEWLGAGYVTLVSSGKGDGSWIVFAFVWPELAAGLESDPDRVFQPISPAHVGL